MEKNYVNVIAPKGSLVVFDLGWLICKSSAITGVSTCGMCTADGTWALPSGAGEELDEELDSYIDEMSGFSHSSYCGSVCSCV